MICGPPGGQADRLGIKNVSPAAVLAQVHLYLCPACSDKQERRHWLLFVLACVQVTFHVI